MFFNVAAVAALATSFVAALPSSSHLHNAHRNVPTQFQERDGYAKDSQYLEPYAIYHARYETFDCEDKHNDTSFFDSCCHPLLKNQTVADLPDLCYDSCDPEPSTSVEPTWSSTKIVTSTRQPEPTSHEHTWTYHPETSVRPMTTEHPTTSVHHTTSAKPAAPSPNDGGDGGNGGGSTPWRNGGFGTYFMQDGNAGACGKVHGEMDLIVAIDQAYYGNLNAVSKYCGQKVLIVNLNNGKSVTAEVADVCPSCVNNNCLDMSQGTFFGLGGTIAEGMFPIKYQVL